MFWQILRQSVAYGAVGGVFSYSVALLFADRLSFLDFGYLVLFTIGGVIGGVVLGLVAALLTFHIFYPMRSPRLYQAAMFFIPLIMPIFSVLSSPISFFELLSFLQSTFSPTMFYMLWATQRISASAIRNVGVVEIPYDRSAPDILDSYLPEGRRALFDMAPEIADRMEYLAGLGMLARWRGALLARLDLRPGMRAAGRIYGICGLRCRWWRGSF
ncbi:hypothetical protein F8S13_19470 [Chloroflexia bacterium SDU3-3]|nr:hypothetical protein F8S13_19470 [Chloroflexia bacterium SDU3-3]